MSKDLNKYFKISLVIILGLAAWGVTGCGSKVKYTDEDTEITGNLIGFASNEELVAYLKDQYKKSVFSDHSSALTERAPVSGQGAAFDSTGGTEEASYNAPSANDTDTYTGTNIQEAGVDESDVVKTDGNYLYIAGDDKVTVVSGANPMTIVSTITVNGSVDSIYLYNTETDKLLVVLYAPMNYEGTDWLDPGIPDAITTEIAYWIPVQAKTGTAFYNVTDPSAPEEIKTVEAEGYLVSSRRVENRLHVVQQFLPDLPDPYQLESEIEDMTIRELAPFYSDVTGASDGGQETQLVAAEAFYHPSIDGGGSIVTIMTFDLDNLDQPFESTGVVADASIVYASTEALYCTSTYWNYSGDPGEPVEQTVIYKFDISGYQAIGQGYAGVKGRALNQFSLGEFEGVLRIATTTGWSWNAETPSKNHVFCLDAEDGALGIIGRMEDIAQGEELYSARFVGPRGYLVTFVTIDPLFTLDLSDPTAPKIVGELKVPGYSTYIHPWGDNYLITIGKDTIEDEGFTWYQGVQLSIFDISNFAEPRLLFKEVIGDRGTESEALYNHKAFTFWEAKGLLALPINLYELQTGQTAPYDYGEFTFKGLYVYRVSIENGFESIGRISTSSELNEYWYYYNDWTRGVFIVDNVYAVTRDAVRSAEINDIEGTIQPPLDI